ncbi:helix-turn-helix transcriptional regulator [Acinetobacter ursingii]|uniref:helix-turn-helix transcriptional regulator n=1 Tax=Acinetobacter ursingii TaxID=108980 RepID=UPI000F769C19|nr:DNA-binding protein [Acinetobacter ursingii]RSO82886.1 DNA-binding protein [Acinetobacter ursingii]
MNKRPNKLDRMTPDQKDAAKKEFWNATNDALFSIETVALVLDVSTSLLQQKRCDGNGIPFTKISPRKIRYIKSDVLDYYYKRKGTNTSNVSSF